MGGAEQSRFCQRCGTHRVGALRFCRNCGFDFDSVAGRTGSALTPSPTHPAQVLPTLDRQARLQADRAQAGWSCLEQVMTILGAVGGLLGGAYLAFGLLANASVLLQFMFALVISPLIGAAVAWWFWTELWRRR